MLKGAKRYPQTYRKRDGTKNQIVDWGKEYEGCLLPLLKEMGILSEKTPPYSSQSNGKAEGLNWTLNEHVRSMLFQANMLKLFWAEAMATATYLINRLSSESITMQSHMSFGMKNLSVQNN